MKRSLALLVAATLFTVGCRKPPTPPSPPPPQASAPTPPPVLEAAATPPGKRFDTYSQRATAWLKDSRDLAGQYTAEAKKALEKLDMATLKDKATALFAAVDKGDFIAAEKAAREVDTKLESDVVSQSVNFLKIEARDGVGAAVKAVDEYLTRPDLSAAQREFFDGFKKGLQDRRTKKGVEFACHAFIAGCHLKYDKEGGAVAATLVSLLFNEKDGVFKDYGIMR